MSTNLRPLIVGGSLAVLAIGFVSVGAYRSHHKAPAPIVAPAPPPVAIAPKPPEVTPPPPAKHAKPKRTAEEKKVRREARERIKERRYKSKGKRRGEDVKTPEHKAPERHKAPESGGEVASRIKEDAHGGRQISCAEVRKYAKLPRWLTTNMEALATPEQIARGKKCLGVG